MPAFYAGDLFCPVGKTPLYLGQPVALLIFETLRRLRSGAARAARRDLREVRRGDRPASRCRTTAPIASRAWPARRPTRPTSIRRSRQAGSVRRASRTSALPVWAPLARHDAARLRQGRDLRRADPRRACRERSGAAGARPRIRDAIRRPDVPRAGSAASPGTTRRRQQARARARRAVAVRGGRGDRLPARRSRARLQAGAHQRAFRLYRRRLRRARPHAVPALRRAWRRCSFPAGRCGSRTTAISSSRAASSVTPSRCARGSASIARPARSAPSPPTTSWTAAASPTIRPASPTVGATGAIGIYDIPKVDVTTVALHSRGVTAGSMRGYGTLQTMTALEVLVDEAAAALPLDPIEFRRRNALKAGGRTMTGNPYTRLGPHAGDPRQAGAAPDLAASAPQEKARGQRAACSSAPASPASPRITAPAPTARWARWRSTREGRITIHCDHVEMGNGIGTALANRVAAHLGGVADEVAVAQVDAFDALGLVTSGDPYTMDQATQDAAARNPRWVPAISSATERLDRRACRHAGGGRGGARRCSASGCGRRRSSCGASRRPIRGPTQWDDGALAGRAARSCRAWRRCRCRRSPRRRMRATA